MSIGDEHRIDDPAALEALYGPAHAASLRKELDFIHPLYARFIEAAPFCVLATAGPGGLDASPRGDGPGFVAVHDPKTLLLPDRPGNNRLDSLRNIVAEPRVGLLFLVPGVGETLRVNGRAFISTDPGLRARFTIRERAPRSVIVVAVEAVYAQCSKAVIRARLWDPAAQVPRSSLPSLGEIMVAVDAAADADAYDKALPERLASTLY